MTKHEIPVPDLAPADERPVERDVERVRGAVRASADAERGVVETVADAGSRTDLEAAIEAYGLGVSR